MISSIKDWKRDIQDLANRIQQQVILYTNHEPNAIDNHFSASESRVELIAEHDSQLYEDEDKDKINSQ